MKVLVSAFNQEKALVGAFSGHYVTSRRFFDSSITQARPRCVRRSGCAVCRWRISLPSRSPHSTEKLNWWPACTNQSEHCGHVTRSPPIPAHLARARHLAG